MKKQQQEGFYWYKADNKGIQTCYGDKDGYEMIEIYGPCKGNLMRAILHRGGDEFNIPVDDLEKGELVEIKNPSGGSGRS